MKKDVFFSVKHGIYEVNDMVKWMKKYTQNIQEKYEKDDKIWRFNEKKLNIGCKLDGKWNDERKIWFLKMRRKETKL